MKVLYITTIGGTMPFFENFISFFISLGNKVDIACNEKAYSLPLCFREWGCKVYNIDCNRSPFVFSNIIAINQIKNIVLNSDYDIVHCHTPIAAACTRIACKLVNKNIRVIYTAHGFHFYKGAPLLNWLIYFPVEWILSFFTDTLITINTEDYELAMKYLFARKTEYIPGVGIDVQKFANTKFNRELKRKELGIPYNCKLLLSVGELNENKNHKVIIDALYYLKDYNIHYAIAGKGYLWQFLRNYSKELHLEDKIHLLGYRNDIDELLKISDVFVLPSKREGLNVSIMEALASGLPILCSNIRGNVDMVKDSYNGITVDISNLEQIANAIKAICNSKISNLNCMESAKKFDFKSINDKTLKIYNI